MEAAETQQDVELRELVGQPVGQPNRPIGGNASRGGYAYAPLASHPLGDPNPIIVTDIDIARGQSLYLHLQQLLIGLLLASRFSPIPEERERRSFISKKAVLTALVALVIAYTIIFYADTGTAFAAAVAAGSWLEPYVRWLFSICQAWVNSGLNAVGIIDAAQESTDYVLALTNNIEPNRAELLKYKDQGRKAKAKRAAIQVAQFVGTMAVTVPPALAAAFMAEGETPFTQTMIVLVNIPSQFLAVADTFARSTPPVWNAILSQIETNFRILQNDLANTDLNIQTRGNKIVRTLLEKLPALKELPSFIEKGTFKKEEIEAAVRAAFQNGKGVDLLFELLTMHGGKNPDADHRDDVAEYVLILQDPMSKTGKALSVGLSVTCATGAMGFSHASIKKLDSWYGIIPLFTLSSFSNIKLGWRGGKGVVSFFYDWWIRGQKNIGSIGSFWSERPTRTGRFFGNILSLIGGALAVGCTAAFASWGTNWLANKIAMHALLTSLDNITMQMGFTAFAFLSNANFMFWCEAIATVPGIVSSFSVNLRWDIALVLVYMAAVKLYANGNDRTQRNIQFTEQGQYLIKLLREIPKENIDDMLAFLAGANPEFAKLAVEVCIQAGVDGKHVDASGLMGKKSNHPYKRNTAANKPKIKLVWESEYRSFGNRGVNFYDLPDISSVAPPQPVMAQQAQPQGRPTLTSTNTSVQ